MIALKNWRTNLSFVLAKGPSGIKGRVAKLSGFHHVHLSNMLAEPPRRVPNFKIAIAISETLEIPVSDLLVPPSEFEKTYGKWEAPARLLGDPIAN